MGNTILTGQDAIRAILNSTQVPQTSTAGPMPAQSVTVVNPGSGTNIPVLPNIVQVIEDHKGETALAIGGIAFLTWLLLRRKR